MKKIYFVSGSTDGIGKQTAMMLAGSDTRVIIHGRTEAKCLAAKEEIESVRPGSSVDIAVADLSSLENVRVLAYDLHSRYDRLDVLVNNAGVFMNQKVLTPDGYEMTFAVNHLSTFLLTQLMLPLLEKPLSSRIVTVSSIAHRNGSIDPADLNSEHGFSGYAAYASSKLMNILFTLELAERLKGTKVTANCLHPGVVGTKLLKTGFNGMNGNDSLETGAETSVFLSTSPDIEGITGKYFVRKKEAPVSAAANDAILRKELWKISEEFCLQR
jgi:NAD(P)-dependent dehydrogenase (short-subunit alcohol dehydrogenase family)